MKTRTNAFRAVLTALAVVLAGCGPSLVASPAAPGAAPPAALFSEATPSAAVGASARAAQPVRPTAHVTFHFKAPQRKLQALSTATDHVSVTVGADDPVEAAMTDAGATLDVVAPVGEDIVFEVETFDSSNNRLAHGSAIADIVEATENTVNVSLGGVPAALELATADETPDIPATDAEATGTLTISALDAAGAVIVGNYDEEVTVAINGAPGEFTLSDTVATSSDMDATYAYTNTGGLDDTTPVQIGATASGASPASLTLTPRIEPKAITITSTQTPAGLVDDTLAVSAEVTFSNGTTSTSADDYTVASSDQGVLDGVLKALAVGDSTITVTAAGTVDSGETVADAVTARIFTLTADTTATAPTVGADVPLAYELDAPAASTVAGEDWTLDATDDATLTDDDGPTATLQASAAGTYDLTFTYTDDDGYSIARDFQVTVLEPLFGTAGTQDLQLLSLDDARAFTVNGAYGGAVTTESSTPAVATAAYLAGELTITPVAVGSTTVTATAADGRVATFHVTVTTSTLNID